MGRIYIVENAVEEYLSKLCSQQATQVTGLIIGQSSAQRDFVVMAAQTPQKEYSVAGQSLDKEWISEHARQVSRMLPGGLSVLGVFIITNSDAKDTLPTLQQLVFSVENFISSEHIWNPSDDDVTDRVALHINPQTRKTVCRTFNLKDPKSGAKPADWKYQSHVCSSWAMLSCWLTVDLLVPLPENRTCTQSMDKCLKEELKGWAHQIENGVFLINGKKLPKDAEFAEGQKKTIKQMNTAQILITPDEHWLGVVSQLCSGGVSIRGAIHSRAFLHSNRPKAKLAEKLLKRDAISTVATRVQMLLEDLLMSDMEKKGNSSDMKQREQLSLPRRIFCPVKAAWPLSVCDYHFCDEGLSVMIDRLKEMLDIDAAEEDLDTSQEMVDEVIDDDVAAVIQAPTVETVEAPEPQGSSFMGVAMATAAALLAAAASMLYLSDI